MESLSVKAVCKMLKKLTKRYCLRISDRPKFGSVPVPAEIWFVSGSSRNLDLNQNSGFGSGKTWNFGFGRNFGSKVNQNLGIF